MSACGLGSKSVLVRVRPRNRWHLPTGEFEDNSIKGIFIKIRAECTRYHAAPEKGEGPLSAPPSLKGDERKQWSPEPRGGRGWVERGVAGAATFSSGTPGPERSRGAKHCSLFLLPPLIFPGTRHRPNPKENQGPREP